ncbi:hypothetical protein PYCC9005_000551 [Savitreella phatthalungensis]
MTERIQWSDILHGARREVKPIPERTIIVLGGGANDNRDFCRGLIRRASHVDIDDTSFPSGRAPFFQVSTSLLDKDKEELALFSIFSLPRLLRDSETIIDTLVRDKAQGEASAIILLDWNDLWSWPETLVSWLRCLPHDVSVAIVCQHAEQMRRWEAQHGLTLQHFDYVQQMLRTVSMVRRCSLSYQSLAHPGTEENTFVIIVLAFCPADVASARGLTADNAPAETIEQEQILVPEGWDTAGKIKTISERFDVEQAVLLWNTGLAGDASALLDDWQATLNPIRPAEAPQFVPERRVELVTYRDFVNRLYDKYGKTGVQNDARSTMLSTASTGKSNVSAILGPLGSGPDELDNETELIAEKLRGLGGSRFASSELDLSNTSPAKSKATRDEVVSQFFKNLLERGRQDT